MYPILNQSGRKCTRIETASSPTGRGCSCIRFWQGRVHAPLRAPARLCHLRLFICMNDAQLAAFLCKAFARCTCRHWGSAIRGAPDGESGRPFLFMALAPDSGNLVIFDRNCDKMELVPSLGAPLTQRRDHLIKAGPCHPMRQAWPGTPGRHNDPAKKRRHRRATQSVRCALRAARPPRTTT
jgi:hypothetical protein